MANIQSYLDAIESAVYGEEVRSSIYNAIKKVNDDNDSYISIKDEIVDSAKTVNNAMDSLEDAVNNAASIVSTADQAATAAAKAMNDANNAIADIKSYSESASASASTATTKASEASASAATAQAASTNASSSASAAKTSASNASASETAAKAAQTSAESSATEIKSKISEATTAADTATTKASEAATSAEKAEKAAKEATAIAGGGVTSFNGRSGAVYPASGDYTADMVGAVALDSSGKVPVSQIPALDYDASGSADAALSKAKTWVEAKGYLTSESDPTVPAWAKASTKPTYTASEVGADASGSADTALSNAKTWVTEQGYQTAAQVQAAIEENGSGIDISGATAGQVPIISTVDSTGKPSAWTAKNSAPIGWTKIADTTTTASVAGLCFSSKNSTTNTYDRFTDLLIFVDAPISSSSSNFAIYVDDESGANNTPEELAFNAAGYLSSTTVKQHSFMLTVAEGYSRCIGSYASTSSFSTSHSTVSQVYTYNHSYFCGVYISCYSGFPTGTKIKVYAR